MYNTAFAIVARVEEGYRKDVGFFLLSNTSIERIKGKKKYCKNKNGPEREALFSQCANTNIRGVHYYRDKNFRYIK